MAGLRINGRRKCVIVDGKLSSKYVFSNFNTERNLRLLKKFSYGFEKYKRILMVFSDIKISEKTPPSPPIRK